MRHRAYNGNPTEKRAQIAARARRNPADKFNNLVHHLTPELIEECLDRIPKKSSPGIDGMSVEEAKANLSWLLPPILASIHKGRYEAPSVKRVYIPKPDGRKRPLGIPTVLDRAIQAAMAEILKRIYEQDFLNCSFGFRNGLSCHNALATIGTLIYEKRMLNALEVDIRDFFGSINHGWMMKFLAHRVSDKRVHKLIEAWLKAGIMEEGIVHNPEDGTPQGGSISPLLANIYLHYVLDLWWEKKIKHQLKGSGSLIRYCDDFVFLLQEADDAELLLKMVKTRLAQFGLDVADKKTHITYLDRGNAGKGKRRRRIEFLGFSIYRTLNWKKTGYKVVFRTNGKRFSRSKKAMRERLRCIMHKSLGDQARYLNSMLRGHYNYYGLPGNSVKLGRFWNEARKAWKFILSRQSQRGVKSWTQMKETVFSKYPLVLPRIKISYSMLNEYAVEL